MSNKDRHAYLIKAHNNPYILRRLIGLLDHPRNDIYIHIDRKSKVLIPADYENSCHHSLVTIVPRVDVIWGEYSQVISSMELLKAAVPHEYMYYHAISGVDLPIKTQPYIHRFFDDHRGLEFVKVLDAHPTEWINRIYLSSKNQLSKSPRQGQALRKLQKGVIRVSPRMIGRIRAARGFEFKKGSDWYSITHALGSHLIHREREIKRRLSMTYHPSEFYVQSIAWNSSFRDSISPDSMANMRLIDWQRSPNGANPWVFRQDDFRQLVNSDRLFARKFDADVDVNIVDRICAHLEE